MRVNELHASAKQVQRSSGRSSVAAAAYRSGELIVDERTGIVHDYTKKGGVEHTRIYVPDNAPDWARDRSTLWNAVELKENRSNSCTARELEVAFPYEFNAQQRREAGEMISQEIMRRYGCAVDIAYHQPNREGDERNFHAHILFTTRGFDENTKDGWATNKYRDLNNDKIEQEDGQSTTRGKAEIHDLRKFTAATMNQIAERDNLDVRTEHLSFAARGIEKEPTQKMGYMATQLERRGIQTERGDINRAIIASNDNMGETTAQLAEQKRVLLLEQNRALLALEQEEGNRFSGNKIASLGQEQVSFAFHEKQIEQAQNELTQAKERLDNITLIERMTGKRSAYEADIQAKETALREAQNQLDEIKRKEPTAQNININITNQITADRTAQYKQEQGEAAALQVQLENRSNIERIIGAITGRTKEQKERLESLQQSIRMYEADKRLEEIRAKQIEDMKRTTEAKARDQSRANDNPAERQPQSVEDRKAEFLERMAKERAERGQAQKLEAEKTPTVEKVETQKQEEARTLTPEERKQEFLDRMDQEREQVPERDKDRGRE